MDEYGSDTEGGGVGTNERGPRVRANDANARRISRAIEDFTFDRAEFPAWIKAGGTKFNNHGDCEVTFVVPAEHREVFGLLGSAMRVPLTVIVEKFDGRTH